MGNPHNAPESARAILAQFLKFMGLIVCVGGSLALIRLLGTPEERNPFYAALMPLGLIVWAVGYYLARPRN